MHLIIENIRCMSGRHVAPLAPITILLGENSSGKSSFLAGCRLAWDAICNPGEVDFNDEPFRLGSFDDILTREPEKRAATFAVGMRLPCVAADDRSIDNTLPEIEVSVTFSSRSAQPVVTSWKIECGNYSVVLDQPEELNSDPVIEAKTPSGSIRFFSQHINMRTITMLTQMWSFIQYHMDHQAEQGDMVLFEYEHKPSKKDLDTLEMIFSCIQGFTQTQRPYATAPVRTKALRTYDPLSDKPTPEGGHVPMYLAKLQLESTERGLFQWQSTIKALDGFAQGAGLFDHLDVLRLGSNGAGSPFQVRISRDKGQDFNLVDVGYGVSQVLPIIVDAMTNTKSILLLQQPEVHLHPRAQAQLGTFFAGLVKERRGLPVLIETHSDYLVDRVRMAVRDEILKPSDVVILHFGCQEGRASINPIRVDRNGNLTDIPNQYRQFFLREERKLLRG